MHCLSHHGRATEGGGGRGDACAAGPAGSGNCRCAGGRSDQTRLMYDTPRHLCSIMCIHHDAMVASCTKTPVSHSGCDRRCSRGSRACSTMPAPGRDVLPDAWVASRVASLTTHLCCVASQTTPTHLLCMAQSRLCSLCISTADDAQTVVCGADSESSCYNQTPVLRQYTDTSAALHANRRRRRS